MSNKSSINGNATFETMRRMKILTVGMLEANSKESSSSSSSRRHFGNGMFAAILLKSDKKITKLIFDFDGLSL